MAAKFKKVWPIPTLILATVAGFFLIENKTSLAKDVENIYEACLSIQNKEQCYGKAFGNLTKKTDMPYAFEVLHGLQEKDQGARGCHFIAHSISLAETSKNPARWKEVMNSAPQDCSYGAVHGALEYYASTFPDGKLPKHEIGNLCNNPDTNNCSHGLGHVLLVVNENDVNESASDCEALPHDARAKFECLTGVFMERSTAINLVAHGLADREALNWLTMLPQTEALCRVQSGTRAVACWKETVHVGVVALKNDPQKVIELCERAPSELATKECIDHSLGVIAGTQNFDLFKLQGVCEAQVKAPDFKDRCYPTLVASVLSTIPTEINTAKNFCASIANLYQKSCFRMIENFERGFRTPQTLD